MILFYLLRFLVRTPTVFVPKFLMLRKITWKGAMPEAYKSVWQKGSAISIATYRAPAGSRAKRGDGQRCGQSTISKAELSTDYPVVTQMKYRAGILSFLFAAKADLA